MKTLTKKTSIFVSTLAFIAVLGVSIFPAFNAYGQTGTNCTQFGNQGVGTLSGYIVASNLPSDGDQNKIWLSSVDDPWTTGPAYGVNYDNSTHTFSGRGWNEGLRVWLDFDHPGNPDQARVLDSNGTPVGGFTWGNWNGNIQGLNGLSLDPDPTVSGFSGSSGFTGTNPYDVQYVSGQTSGDVPVGLGELSFDNVVYNTQVIPPECLEYVDVLANGASSVSLPTCGSGVGIVWNSNNVVPGSCFAWNNGAPWPNPGASVPDNNMVPVQSGAITTTNSPAYFRVECLGSVTGGSVLGTATVSCSNITDVDPYNERTPFEYIES
jgi:hypothetical protein